LGSQPQFQRFAALPLEGAEQAQHSTRSLCSNRSTSKPAPSKTNSSAELAATLVSSACAPIRASACSPPRPWCTPSNRSLASTAVAASPATPDSIPPSIPATRPRASVTSPNKVTGLLGFLLIEAAHTAIRDDEDLRRFYFHLLAKKNHSIAIVAVARKLVLRLYRMRREHIDYDQFRRRSRDARRARECASSSASPRTAL
jgi:hypothetical protein